MAASKEQIGALAHQLRENAAFKEIITGMKANILRDWANTPSTANEIREGLYRDVQAIGRLEAALQAAVGNTQLDDRKAAAKKGA